MRYGSVCSGIEAASVAWKPLGWRAQFFSEIEAFPSAVLAHHYPDVPNFGDMTKFKEWPDVAIDLLVGGTPCQSFSVAGLRAGLADPRGNLALTYLAIAARYRPRWVVWENVPGVFSSLSHDAPDPSPPPDPVDLERDGQEVGTVDEYDAIETHAFGTFLAGLSELGYGLAYRTLDAQFARSTSLPFAVPQRRRRVFVVGYLGDWRRAAAVLFDGASLRGDSPPRREARKTTTAAVADSIDGSCAVSGCDRPAEKRGWCNTHYQRWRKHGIVTDTPVNEPGRPDADRFWEKVVKRDGDDACWDWDAALNEKGYGIFWSNAENRTVRAHRFSYEEESGEIPEGMELDHLCRNRKCVRPSHLEVVTGAENTRRGNAGKHWADKRAASDVAPTISARPTGGGGLGTDFDLDGGLISGPDVSPALKARDAKGPSSDGDGDGAPLLAVAHALRADGFDASEDGTGRGTPIIPEVAGTLKEGSGHRGYANGAEVADRLIPEIAQTLTRGAESSGKGGYAGRRQEDDSNLVALPFDTTQITHPENRSNPQPGDPAGSLAKGGHPPAIAIQERAVSENLENGPQGKGYQEGIGYTLEARNKVQAVVFQPRFVRNDRGAPETEIAGPLTAEAGQTGRGDSAQVVAYGIRSDASRPGEALTPSADAEGNLRLRNPGMGVYEELAPTVDASAAHTVATNWVVRRLTPTECERLQGFPDSYTAILHRGKPAADGPRYKALGNSMATNVMQIIGERIQMVEDASG